MNQSNPICMAVNSSGRELHMNENCTHYNYYRLRGNRREFHSSYAAMCQNAGHLVESVRREATAAAALGR